MIAVISARQNAFLINFFPFFLLKNYLVSNIFRNFAHYKLSLGKRYGKMKD